MFRRCSSIDNIGTGFQISLGSFDGPNVLPVSISFEQCSVSWSDHFRFPTSTEKLGTGRSGYAILSSLEATGGSINIVGGSVQRSRGPGIFVSNKRPSGPTLTVSGVILNNTARFDTGKTGHNAPIVLYDEVGGVGGVWFEDVTILDSFGNGNGRPFLRYNRLPCGDAKRPVSACPNTTSNIRGTFTVVVTNGSTTNCSAAAATSNCSATVPFPQSMSCWRDDANIFGSGNLLRNLSATCLKASDRSKTDDGASRSLPAAGTTLGASEYTAGCTSRTDCSKELQAAIYSGAPVVRIPNLGFPWVVCKVPSRTEEYNKMCDSDSHIQFIVVQH